MAGLGSLAGPSDSSLAQAGELLASQVLPKLQGAVGDEPNKVLWLDVSLVESHFFVAVQAAVSLALLANCLVGRVFLVGCVGTQKFTRISPAFQYSHPCHAAVADPFLSGGSKIRLQRESTFEATPLSRDASTNWVAALINFPLRLCAFWEDHLGHIQLLFAHFTSCRTGKVRLNNGLRSELPSADDQLLATC